MDASCYRGLEPLGGRYEKAASGTPDAAFLCPQIVLQSGGG
jgi:hypothetical protein